jgi:hypothetical protein
VTRRIHQTPQQRAEGYLVEHHPTPAQRAAYAARPSSDTSPWPAWRYWEHWHNGTLPERLSRLVSDGLREWRHSAEYRAEREARRAEYRELHKAHSHADAWKH